jgi:hypothetical protein
MTARQPSRAGREALRQAIEPVTRVYVRIATVDAPLSHCVEGDHKKSPGRRSTGGSVVRREGIEPPTRWLGVA